MKKTFILLTVLSLAAMTACTDPNENPYDSAPVPVLTLNTSTIAAEHAGGDFTVDFAIENPGEWAQLRATTEASWITNIDWSEQGKISFSVEPNTISKERTGTVVVAYDFKEYPISVTQAEYKVVYEAPLSVGLFYGSGNYQFQLGASDYILNQQLVANARYYIFDIYAPAEQYPADPDCFDLPMGTYTIDTLCTYEVGTVSGDYSYYLETDASNVNDLSFVSGTVTIDENGVKAVVFTEDGIKHEVTGSKHIHASSSTIHEDMNILFTEGMTLAGATYWGDYYAYLFPGANANFDLELIDMELLIAVSLDLVSNTDLGPTEIPTGKYTVYEPSWVNDMEGNATLPGYFGGTKAYPSFAATLTSEGLLTGISFFAGGEVEISKNDDGTYTVTINAINDTHDGNKITGTWTGNITIEDGTAASNYQAPMKKAANRTNRYPAKAKRERF